MSLCTVKCAICGGFLSRTTTKRGKPFLYCGLCGYGVMLLRKSAEQALDSICQNVEEGDLPPKTLEKHRQRQQQQ